MTNKLKIIIKFQEVYEKEPVWRQIIDEFGVVPVDPIVFYILTFKFEASLTLRLLVMESVLKGVCNDTKIFNPGIGEKLYSKVKGFGFKLRTFLNTVFFRKNLSFQTLTFVFKRLVTGSIKSTKSHFQLFWSVEYAASYDSKNMILRRFQFVLCWCIIQSSVDKKCSRDVK
jgi:hypothetical protein